MTYDHLRVSVYAWLTIVAAVALLGLSACGGPPRATRVAVAQLGDGLNVADESLTAEVARRGEASREQVRREAAEGVIADVAAGLARFEELMMPTTDARNALRGTSETLRAVERAFDAWAAGTGDEADFLEAVGCVVAALTHLAGLLAAAGVDMPEELAGPMSLLESLAGSICPEPEPS